jgi:hypothetical protein
MSVPFCIIVVSQTDYFKGWTGCLEKPLWLLFWNILKDGPGNGFTFLIVKMSLKAPQHLGSHCTPATPTLLRDIPLPISPGAAHKLPHTPKSQRSRYGPESPMTREE